MSPWSPCSPSVGVTGSAAALAAPVTVALLGKGLGVDIDDGRADVLGDPGEAVGEVDRLGDTERARVGGVDGLVLRADRAGEHGVFKRELRGGAEKDRASIRIQFKSRYDK